MIERENYQDVKAFIKYQDVVEQKDPDTLRNYWVCLRHLLQWADAVPFPQMEARQKIPFSVYLPLNRNDEHYQHKSGVTLALAMQEKVCSIARMFFKWAKLEYTTRYKRVSLSWISALKPSRRTRRESAKMRKVVAWELDDVLKVARLTDDDLRIRRLDGLNLDALAQVGKLGRLDVGLFRAQAAVCFLYLSGMRSTAFLSIPISCINLEEGTVEQDPDKGVMTKFRKAAITGFLPIPELMQPVRRWDALVRAACPGGRWYANLGNWGEILPDTNTPTPELIRSKRTSFIDSIKKVCEIAGVPFKSPHKLRHGHAVYGVKNARTIAELKAVSQNLMHGSIQITDGIYGNLTGEDTRRILATLDHANDSRQPGSQPAGNMAELLKDPAVVAFLQVLQTANVGGSTNPTP